MASAVAASTELEGYDLDRFVNRGLAETLQCSICLGVLREPRQCWRQHLFCKLCLNAALDGKTEPSCPVCRCELSVGKNIAPAQRVIEQILRELLIHCIYFERGCEEVVKLGDLKKHEDQCEFRERQRFRSPYPNLSTTPDSVSKSLWTAKEESAKKGANGPIGAHADTVNPHLRKADEDNASFLFQRGLKHSTTGGQLQPEPRRRRARGRHHRKQQGRLNLEMILQQALQQGNGGLLPPASAVDFVSVSERAYASEPEYNAFSEWEATLPVFVLIGWLLCSQWFPDFMTHTFRRQAFAAFVVVSEFWSYRDHANVLSLASANNSYGLKIPLVRRLVQKSVINVLLAAALLLPPCSLLVYLGALTLVGLHAWSVLCTDDPSMVGTDLGRMLVTWDYWQMSAVGVAVWYNLQLSPPMFNVIILVAFVSYMYEQMPVVKYGAAPTTTSHHMRTVQSITDDGMATKSSD